MKPCCYMEHFIKKSHLESHRLDSEEASDLYEALHYYGRRNTLEAARDVYDDEMLPLAKHWEDLDDFESVWEIYYDLARMLPKSRFVDLIVNAVEFEKLLSAEQRTVLSNPKDMLCHACYLLDFFDTMADYFDYEIKMLSYGYPHEHRKVS